MIKWGIIGPGKIAHKFASDLATVSNAKLVAVASRNLGRAKEFADEYGAELAFGNYEDFLASTAFDIVYIASPHIGHYEHTLLCLNAGKAVLCEKPFAMNAAEVLEMIELAKKKNVFLMEALWTRFKPTTLKTLDLLKTIGKVSLVKADFGFKADFDPEKRLFNKDLGGGALLDIGIYPLFLSYLILGNPAEIKATTQFSVTGVDQTDGIALNYAKGAIAVLDCTLMATTNCEAQIFGEFGTILIHSRWHESQKVSVNYYDGREETYDFSRDTHGYDYEINEVNNCLLEKQVQSQKWSWNDSINLINLLDGVRAQSGIVY